MFVNTTLDNATKTNKFPSLSTKRNGELIFVTIAHVTISVFLLEKLYIFE